MCATLGCNCHGPYCVLFNSRVKERFSVWLVSDYAPVFVLLSVVTEPSLFWSVQKCQRIKCVFTIACCLDVHLTNLCMQMFHSVQVTPRLC